MQPFANSTQYVNTHALPIFASSWVALFRAIRCGLSSSRGAHVAAGGRTDRKPVPSPTRH